MFSRMAAVLLKPVLWMRIWDNWGPTMKSHEYLLINLGSGVFTLCLLHISLFYFLVIGQSSDLTS